MFMLTQVSIATVAFLVVLGISRLQKIIIDYYAYFINR